MFHTREQGEGETIDSFTTDIRLKSQSCEFGSLQDSLIRDRVVVGISDSKIKERLLRDSELTLERAIDIFKANEAENKSVNWRRKQCKCEHDSKTEKN